MRLSRMLGITTSLLNNKSLTAKQLAKQYEVSERTIYRDIEAMAAAGLPIYMRQGKGGGISLIEDYTVSRAMLSDSDYEQLILSIQALSATEFSQSSELLDKIKSIYRNRSVNNWIEIEFVGWEHSLKAREKFEIIKSGVIHSENLKICYINSSGTKTSREVSPIRIIFKSKTWYLLAHCKSRNAIRLFRLSRILNVSKTGTYFEHIDTVDTAYTCKEPQKINLVTVHLRFASKSLFRIYDEFDPDILEYNDDGSVEVKVTYPMDQWIYSFLLSMGDSVEVISPNFIREELILRAESIVNKYSKNKREA